MKALRTHSCPVLFSLILWSTVRVQNTMKDNTTLIPHLSDPHRPLSDELETPTSYWRNRISTLIVEHTADLRKADAALMGGYKLFHKAVIVRIADTQ